MVQSSATALSREAYVKAYRFMLLARLSEEKIAGLYRAGKIVGGVFLSKGQEAVSAALGCALRKGDVFAPLIRDQAGRLAFGEPLIDGIRTYLGSARGPMRGREGNVHRGNPSENILPMISHLGVMVSTVAGMLIAHRFNGITGTVGATCIGEGGTSTGAFHEGLNLVAVERLPMVIVVVNNQYAYSTPNSRQFACRDLVDRAIGYGIEGHSLDGTDFSECLTVLDRVVDRARTGHGPQLVVASVLRLCGHGEHDDGSYIDPALKQSAVGRDCVRRAEDFLLENELASRAELDAWRAEATEQIEETVATVQREAAPDPQVEEWCALSNRHLADGFAQ